MDKPNARPRHAAPRRGRRGSLRLPAVWLLAGVLAAAGSAAWASGFATSIAELGDSADAEPVLATEAGTTSSPEWVSQGPDPLTFDFQGRWAIVDDDALLFEVDLSGEDTEHVFQVGLYSVADLSGSGWTDLQLELAVADGSCDSADMSDPDETEALNLLASADASWTTKLDGGSVACVGVPAAGRADDWEGTFARRAARSEDPTMPSFAMSANRIE